MREPTREGLIIGWILIFLFALFGVWTMSALVDLFSPLSAYLQPV